MMRFVFPCVLALAVSSCSTSTGKLPPLSSVKPGVAEEGTIANQVLVRDASAALRSLNGGTKPIAKFLVQHPVGEPGKKAWRELWVYDPAGAKRQFILTFEEDGAGSAEYEIASM